MLAVLQKVSCDLEDKNYPLLETPQSLQEKLAQVVSDNLLASDEQREFCLLSLHLLSLATQRPEIAQWAQQVHNESIQRTQSAVTEAIEQGQIEGRDPAAITAVLMMVLSGISISTTVHDFHIPAEKLIDEIMVMIRRYLKMDDDK